MRCPRARRRSGKKGAKACLEGVELGNNSGRPNDQRKEGLMCMSCGCGQVDDDHGDQANITRDRLKQAADAAGISPEEAAKNIQDAAA